jgi:tetratricopeptide (TPR) repeat protein
VKNSIVFIGLICFLAVGLVGCGKKVVIVKAEQPEVNKQKPAPPPVQNPKASDQHLQQAKKFFAQGKYKQAKKHCEKAIEFNHRNWEAHYFLGLAMQKKNDYMVSIEILGTGLKYAPDNKYVKSEIHYAIGYSWENLGKLDKASKEYQLALSYNSGNKTARQARNRIKIEKTMKKWGKDKEIEYEG